MSPDERAAVARFIAERGVTRCPTAYVAAVTGAERLPPVPHANEAADIARARAYYGADLHKFLAARHRTSARKGTARKGTTSG